MSRQTFDHQATKDGTVRVFWRGRCVMTLGGQRGRLLAAALEDAGDEEVQHLLQRATGNFKRGNERQRRQQPG